MTIDELVGSWRLVSACSTSFCGERDDAPYGDHPSGFLIYTAGGSVCALISHGGRTPISFGGGSVQEQAHAFATFLAYAGNYSLKGDNIIHHVEISSIQSYVGRDLPRAAKFDAGRLVLTTPPALVKGKTLRFELVWRRSENESQNS